MNKFIKKSDSKVSAKIVKDKKPVKKVSLTNDEIK